MNNLEEQKNKKNNIDWWTWIFWMCLVGIIINIIFNLNTLTRWKWGYWSIDLVPPIIMLLLLYIWNQIIQSGRMLKRINELERKIK